MDIRSPEGQQFQLPDGVSRFTPVLDSGFPDVDFSTGRGGKALIAGLSLVLAGSAARQLPRCDLNSVGMTTKDTGVTLECHLNGRWERVVPDPRLAQIIDLPPDVNRDSLKFSGWVGNPQWDPEEKRWVRQARVVGTEGFGVVGVEVKIPHR